MVNVNSQNSQNKISVSSQGSQTNVISVDNSKAKYYSDIATQAASDAALNKNNARIWAEGSDVEVQALGGVHSSKKWADLSSQGQVQTDWNQVDNSQKDFIKNKPNLDLKQDKLIAGTGIEITADNIISNINKSADWGNISGTLSNQTDLSVVLSNKQDTLVSASNIKTINNNSILGSGNLDIDGLPSQTGQSGKYLTTDGTEASWEKMTGWTPSILQHFWSDRELDRMDMLRSDTFSWQDGTVYSDAYTHLVDDIEGKTLQSETIGGVTVQYYLADDNHKICPASEEANVLAIYNVTGVARYYILDQVNTRFKLWREKYNKFVQNQTLPVVGNGLSLGLTDGTSYGGITLTATQGDSTVKANGAYGVAVGAPVIGTQSFLRNKMFGITDDSTKSGIEATYSSTDDSNMYLYFYVGQYSQTAIEQTAGLNAELFNGKADTDLSNVPNSKGILTESYVNGTSWYRVYSDGWCEQGSITICTSSTNSHGVSLLKTMQDTNYIAIVHYNPNGAITSGGTDSPQSFNRYNGSVCAKTTSSFSIQATNLNGGAYSWQVCGYIN